MKRSLLIITIAALCFITGFVFLYPVKIQKKVMVPYTMYKAGEQFNKSENLINWYVPFAGNSGTVIIKSGKSHMVTSGGYSAEIGNITMFSASIEAGYKSNQKTFFFTALSDSAEMLSSTIILSYKSTLFRKWAGKSVLEKNAEQSLENLAGYMTDTKRFYGFDIQKVLVEDTSFLFSRMVVLFKNRKEGTRKIFEKLIDYAEENMAGYNGTRIFYSLKSGDEVILFAGIGVSKMMETTPDGSIQYKRMPFGKNLLVTTYQGPFGESYRAFEALEKFRKDQGLSSMAIPYQKFLSDGYDFSDDQVVQMKVYYPIF
jgi:hypothetical protein